MGTKLTPVEALKAQRDELSNFLRGVAGQEGVWIGPIQGEAIAMQLLTRGYRQPVLSDADHESLKSLSALDWRSARG